MPAAVKLKLMDNEEIFSTGASTSALRHRHRPRAPGAGLIEANLLAAYSSNLFCIVCVALVKIRMWAPTSASSSSRPRRFRLVPPFRRVESLIPGS